MGWGMLHASAGVGGGGEWTDHYVGAATHLQQHEPQLMVLQSPLPPPLITQQDHLIQQDCQDGQHAYGDRGDDDLLASILQVSGQLEESPPSYYDTDGSSSGDGFSCASLSGGLPMEGMRINSVAATRSHLIKEGLKLTIQSRRRDRGQSTQPEDDDYNSCAGTSGTQDELTEEDEERRRRRRERNKVAATKCRNKKKERTQKLAVESTSLESNNQYLKDEIRRLEVERQELMDLLKSHRPACPMSRHLQQPQHTLQHSQQLQHLHYHDGRH